MNHCKDCGWFIDLKDYFDNIIKTCQCPKIREDWGEERKEDELIYCYNEGGRFEPSPMFGCVHWKSKEMMEEGKINTLKEKEGDK